jgi:hypothetical protein
MSSLARIVAAKHLGDHRLLLTFSDGLEREFDFDGNLEGAVFEILRDVSVSSLVAVDEVAGTIGWLSGVDFDPDVLHGDFEAVNGSSAEVLQEYHLHTTG